MPPHLCLVMSRITLFVPLALLLPPSLSPTATAQAPEEGSAAAKALEKSPSEKWEKEIRAFEDADKMSPPPKGAVLFIGSSSTRRWKTLAEDFPEVKVIN